MASIQLNNLRKMYAGGVEAVKGISIDIQDGEFIVLVGPSGCGKSTLLRMVAGLETISDGDLFIGDRIVNDVEPADRDIAMVFQNYALYPHMSVYNNLAYGLKNRSIPKAEIEKRVRKAAEILEIGDFLDRRPRQLSGGQRQRVAMGRAIVREPAAFLFDEPLSNLDAKLRVQMRMEIKKLQKNLKTTSLYVTHDQLEAMTLADRLVVLNNGEVEQIGSPIDVYEKPASTFVATFIGSPAMNLLPLAKDGSEWKLDNGATVDVKLNTELSGLTLGVRPEDLVIEELSEKFESGLHTALTVHAVEPVGAESYVHGTIGEGSEDIVVRAPGKLHFETGQVLKVTAKPEKLHAFDLDTGKRIELDVAFEAA
ncbi:sn-glycerol-3-phosphate import ATP-binding protein UgpC [Pseudovibrio sp. Tun.PSC04-5.I4]|uniref:sn-glycerol-3-phosphate import ATP-binding protein UgpC n=1 Tax=Pseudovibrio sp. Tun.PSC04-5.I4 TaxID=1798213 RepID=UPI00088DE9AD|nr:sn-glycerol-3-phosphate import ATP-binding protein UgpC [Pseudovibrio sp. Tun.PSC04-5.I4]SDR23195.1 carbohydrate ABC transporter ATP-binding protein, CUT1 family [Pseudovibrio sp. Tun.PSC04-5.I4]